MAPEARGRGRPRGRAAGAATRGRGRGREGAAAGATSAENTDTTAAAEATTPGAAAAAAAAQHPVVTTAPTDGSVPPSTRGETVAKPTRGPLAGRRPRNIRRDEASRDALARQEQSKENARAKEEARNQARTRGRSQRSRGSAMGRGGAMSRGGGAAASGPFSQFLESASGRSGGWGGGGGSGGGAGGSGFGSTARGVKGEGKPGFGPSGLYDVEARINADRFAGMPPNREPDASDEATAALINADPGARWPMGILRVDRKEEKKALATTAELEAEEHAQDEESLYVEGEDRARPKPQPAQEDDAVWHAAPKGVTDVKPEGDADVSIDFDAHDKSQTAEPMEIDSKSVSPVGDAPAERRPKKKAALDTETEMMTADMRMLLSELGPADDGSLTHNRDGRLYLFQFPPVLPPLHVISGSSMVKSEGDDTVMLEQGAGGSIDLTGSDEQRKPKVEAETKVSVSEMAENLKQGGMIGKMNVRRSGKVEFDWGGCTLELGPAAGMNFLTTAVIIEEADEKAKNAEHGGDAYGMGKIMGRFVLAPRWSDEEEWVVDPEDLKIDE
ncbi:hypothetical protein HYQ45_013878 [Verticillium longisporum]|uniref:Uncharacterized protein n=1 Tax=Verticillium longisporum TaxID=100787 RepID=A0A0G4NPE4_VERLO|nr:hypothetical protein HYQ45_013878 [Verticillium longisporum]CRK48315.1 hypothetical protein BN1723_007957 [Verticillium longisporum]